MQGLTFAERICLPMARDRRRRRLAPAVVPLEDRRLLSGSSSAVMTQTATFPNIELAPKASTQAILYFSPTMGTLTEVDLVTSGSVGAGFQAENLGTTTTAIEATVAGNVSINVPTGEIPVTIPSLHWAFDAPAFDGTLDYGGTSGKEFAPATSGSSPQTTVLTSATDLAAFTGNFRIPISVSNHTTQSSSAADGKLSALFKTQTSATITVIYHFIPNLPSLDPGPGPVSGQQSSTPPSSANTVATSSTIVSACRCVEQRVAFTRRHPRGHRQPGRDRFDQERFTSPVTSRRPSPWGSDRRSVQRPTPSRPAKLDRLSNIWDRRRPMRLTSDDLGGLG